MRVFKSKWFRRFADKENIEDAALLEAVARANEGQFDANLGGDVLKMRIARQGEGSAAGYRTIVIFRRGTKAFFVYGFAKSSRANIDDHEKKQFKDAARRVLALTDKQLAELLKGGDFVEVKIQ